jgi:hypothetical protein
LLTVVSCLASEIVSFPLVGDARPLDASTLTTSMVVGVACIAGRRWRTSIGKMQLVPTSMEEGEKAWSIVSVARLQPRHVLALVVGVDLQPWSMGGLSLCVMCVVSSPRCVLSGVGVGPWEWCCLVMVVSML